MNETLTAMDYQTQVHQSHYIPYDLYSISQYPWWCLNLFICCWILSNLVHVFLSRFIHQKVRAKFENLDYDKKNNAIIYVLQLLGTTVALIAQLYGASDVIFKWQDTTSESKLKSLSFSIQMIAVLYVWELIFRKKIGRPLLIHHIITILLSQLVTASYFDTHDILYLRFATLLGFHATVEQSSFLALFLFRLDVFEKWQAFWFFFSAVQSLVFKTLVTIVSVVYYILLVEDGRLSMSTNSWEAFWVISTMPLLACLYGAQVYACLILYKLGKRCQVMADLSDLGESRISKVSFREESVAFLAEYETSSRWASKLLKSPRSTMLQIDAATAARSTFLCVASNELEPTPFGRNTGVTSSVTQGTSSHTLGDCSLEVSENGALVKQTRFVDLPRIEDIEKVDSHTFTV